MKKMVFMLVFCGLLGAKPASAWFDNLTLPTFTQVSLFLIASTTKQIVMYVQKGQGSIARSIGLGVVIDSINAILIKEAASAISGAVSKKPKNEDCWRRNDELQAEISNCKTSINSVPKSSYFHAILDSRIYLVSEKLKQRSKFYDNSNLEQEAARILVDLFLEISKLYPGAIQSEFYDSGKIVETAKRYGLSSLLDKSFMQAFNRLLGAQSEYSDRKDYFNRLLEVIKSASDSDL